MFALSLMRTNDAVPLTLPTMVDFTVLFSANSVNPAIVAFLALASVKVTSAVVLLISETTKSNTFPSRVML